MSKLEAQNIFRCTSCGSILAGTASEKAIDCPACYAEGTMRNRGPIGLVVDNLAQHIEQEKNTVRLVRNAMDVLETVHENGGDITPALYDLRVAVDDL